MALIKIKSESMNLADDYAFTGTVSGVGKILQVVHGANSTAIHTNGTSDFDIVTATITPTSSSSTILMLGSIQGIEDGNGSANTRINIKLFRDASQIMISNANHWNFSTGQDRNGGFAINYKDSPSSTSSITYKIVGAWLDTGGAQCGVNKDSNSGNSTLTLLELAG